MDRENFHAIITRYLEKFDLTNGKEHAEWFKWEAIDCFQKNWDIDAEDLYDSFSKAIYRTDVLLDGGHSTPSSGIKALLKIPEEVEFVRDAFRQLLAPGKSLTERDLAVDRFLFNVNARIKTHWPNDGYKPQTTRSALCYLTLADPKRNYFYMYKRADNWANCTEYGFDIGSGSSFSLPVYYGMCEELVSEIKANPRLQQCNEARMKTAGVSIDDDYHTLAYDIMYCATTYNLYVDIPTYQSKSVKERITRAQEREKLDELYQAAVKAERLLEASDVSDTLTFDLIGREVKHSLFGNGTILSLDGYKLTVRFDQGEKVFVHPHAFASKMLSFLSSEDANRYMEEEKEKKQKAQLKEAAVSARAAYEKSKTAFDKKWLKRIQNDQMIGADDE